MLSELEFEQRNLAELMSDISEHCYSARWMTGLEYTLWHAMTTGESKMGNAIIPQTDLIRLRQLSKDSNSWIYYDDLKEETAITISSWNEMFTENNSQ